MNSGKNNQMFELKGKLALVVGGAGYLGTAICRGLASRGANVVVADLAFDRAEDLSKEIGEAFPEVQVEPVGFDLGSEQSMKHAISQITTKLGVLHIVVNCVHYNSGKSVEELTAEDFSRSMQINLSGSFLLARESAQAMGEGGSIIMLSSMYGQVAPDPRVYLPPMNPSPIEYGVAKAGAIQMVKYLAVHWGPRNIRVNAIAPGPFPNLNVQRRSPDFANRLADRVPLGRVGSADEIAGAVVFLASDAASYVTGETLAVDGGWTAW